MGGKKKSPPTTIERLVGLYRSPITIIKASSWGLSIVAGLALIYLVYSLTYLDRVYPNVVIGTHQFSRLTQHQVQEQVKSLAEAQVNHRIVINPPTGSTEASIELSPSDIDWQVDVEATTNQIYHYGRQDGSRLISFIHQLKAPFLKTRIIPTVRYDESLLAAKIGQVASHINNPASDASAILVSDELVTTTEKSGEIINEPLALKEALALLNELASGSITLEKQTDQPEIILGDSASLANELESLSGRSLTLKWNDKTKKLSRKEIRQLVGFVGQTVDGQQIKYLVADFTAEQIQNYLTSIADQTDSPAVEPQLVINDGKLTIVKAAKDGRVVDLNVSAAAILAVLATQGDSPTVELTYRADTPEINESNLANLGIKERIGYGETNMRNSPANRRHNINNGISLLSSALVKPGEEFSTVSRLGAVDNTTGFLPELVIKDNRTVPEFGGGLCQVSTTLFRSVMNAGLKVTERQNHSYRVSYYEPPIGLDATIYLPKPDFKFLNDTPAYILIQAKVVGNRVIFELWGTSDGRTSSISEPIVSNVIEPPPPIYVDSDTLPLGETKITDHAHQGATAIAYYTVVRNGQVINKQTFKSIYKALPERGLHGTNASLPPTVPPPAP